MIEKGCASIRSTSCLVGMAAPSARSINLLDEARKPFLEVADNISDALVYLDAPFGEAAYYNLGLSFLYGLGATAVCSLEDASVNDAVRTKLDISCSTSFSERCFCSSMCSSPNITVQTTFCWYDAADV